MLLHLREGDLGLGEAMCQDRMQENQNSNTGLPDLDPGHVVPPHS